MPQNMSLSKVTALTCYLCKLHNFYINEKEISHIDQTKIDLFYLSVNESFNFKTNEDGNLFPSDVLCRGKHSDDFERRRVPVCKVPHEEMLHVIREKDLFQPSHSKRRQKICD